MFQSVSSTNKQLVLIFSSVLSFSLKVSLQYYSFTPPCPQWSRWKLSPECVMPYELSSQVTAQCPVPAVPVLVGRTPNHHMQQPLLSNQIYGTAGTNRWQSSHGNLGSLYNQWYNGGRWKRRRRRQEPVDDPAVHKPKAKPGNRDLLPYEDTFTKYNSENSYTNPWNYIYTECGHCSMQFRCRARQPAYGCSPLQEIEGAPCVPTPAGAPACQLPGRACNAIAYHPSYGMVFNSIQTARQLISKVRSKFGTGSAHWTNNSWHPIKHWETFSGANKTSLSSVKSPSVDPKPETKLRSKMVKQQPAEGFNPLLLTGIPPMNCVTSGLGCHCCCVPYVPVNGVCQDANSDTATHHSGGSSPSKLSAPSPPHTPTHSPSTTIPPIPVHQPPPSIVPAAPPPPADVPIVVAPSAEKPAATSAIDQTSFLTLLQQLQQELAKLLEQQL